MTKLQFGLQIYSVRDHCQKKEDMLACLKGLKAMGYNVCQMAGQSADITPAELRTLLPPEGPVLVLGVGNRRVTADALGPRTVQKIFVTMGAGRPPVPGIRPVAAVAPGRPRSSVA